MRVPDHEVDLADRRRRGFGADKVPPGGGFFQYLVTNAHVADRGPVARVNLRQGGFDTFPLPADSWVYHPGGDDVAVAPLEFRYDKYAVAAVNHELLLTEQEVGPANSPESYPAWWLWAGR